jgi:UDP-2,3-diacylglucosamine pyrophosphatase LpxH
MGETETNCSNIAYDGDEVIASREILLGELEGAPSADGHNLLVISDIHLGDSLRPTHPNYLKELARLNRALCRFLKHYAKHRANDRPWRLVVAGDFIDFLHAGLYADAEHAGEHRERAFNHCSEEDAIAWLEKVMVRERRVFRLLASFVGAGHDLVIIKGNHDAQFHFEGVQRRFTQLLLELNVRRLLLRRRHAADAPKLAHEMVEYSRRIFFCRWFYYERDLVYIEHGNQYDAFCSFEHVLSPIDPDLFELEDPIGHRTYRAFANMLKSLDLHAMDTWKLFDYVKWIAGLGPKLIGQLAYTYFASLAWMVKMKRRLLAAAKRARVEHLTRRKALEAFTGLEESVLDALDELRARPAGKTLFTGMRMLYMDRVALFLINVSVIVAAAVAPGPWWLRGGIASLIAGASIYANFVLDRKRDVDPQPKLSRISRKIARLLKVPFVVFGHSHRAVMEETREQSAAPSWYFNTGSWTSGPHGLTHVCILRETVGIKAELRRWCLESHKPMKLEEGLAG